jgi:hypothetical protein
MPPKGPAPESPGFLLGLFFGMCSSSDHLGASETNPSGTRTFMLNITITQAGAQAEDPSSKGDPATIIFARIRVLTPEGQALLNLSLEAAEELAKTLRALLAPRSPPASSAASETSGGSLVTDRLALS